MKNIVVALSVAFLSVSMSVSAQDKKEHAKKECCSKDKKKSCSKDEKECHADKKTDKTSKKESSKKV